jgi:hypothetical protein
MGRTSDLELVDAAIAHRCAHRILRRRLRLLAAWGFRQPGSTAG